MTRGTKWAGALACVVVSCGGASEATAPLARSHIESSAPADRRATSPSTLHSPSTKPVHRRARAWRGDGTPAPKLENIGTDHLGIFLSLERYRVWLESHHPDPALVPRVWVDGTEIARRFKRELAELQQRRLRRVDVGDRSEAKVVSVVDGTVTLLVDEHSARAEFVDDAGRVVSARAQGPVFQLVVLLDRGRDGRWRIASVEYRVTDDVEVQL
jgi:hypothetical protein